MMRAIVFKYLIVILIVHTILTWFKIIKDDNQISFVAHLSKCFTYNDIQLMRFSVDFGLGVYNGIELATLPQGQVVRRDIIERSVSFELILISSNSYFSSSSSRLLLLLLLFRFISLFCCCHHLNYINSLVILAFYLLSLVK